MELVTNGTTPRVVEVKRPEVIASLDMLVDTIMGVPRRGSDLGPAQIEWCAKHLKGFAWPGVQRLKEKV